MTFKTKPANQDEVTLYCLVGEALCIIQLLEDALSHAITLKKDVRIPFSIPKSVANELLEAYQSNTLGQGIKLARKENLYPDAFLKELESFLIERNWLVHKCMPQNMDDMYNEQKKLELFNRIKAITTKTQALYQSINDDLIEFSSSNGVDMSSVLAAIEEYKKS